MAVRIDLRLGHVFLNKVEISHNSPRGLGRLTSVFAFGRVSRDGVDRALRISAGSSTSTDDDRAQQAPVRIAGAEQGPAPVVLKPREPYAMHASYYSCWVKHQDASSRPRVRLVNLKASGSCFG